MKVIVKGRSPRRSEVVWRCAMVRTTRRFHVCEIDLCGVGEKRQSSFVSQSLAFPPPPLPPLPGPRPSLRFYIFQSSSSVHDATCPRESHRH